MDTSPTVDCLLDACFYGPVLTVEVMDDILCMPPRGSYYPTWRVFQYTHMRTADKDWHTALRRLGACGVTLEQLVDFIEAYSYETMANTIRAHLAGGLMDADQAPAVPPDYASWPSDDSPRRPAAAAVITTYPAPCPNEESAPEGTPAEFVCAICLDRKTKTICRPCNHVMACVTCILAAKPTTCPSCRTPLTSVERIY